jgi:hypothetical protein
MNNILEELIKAENQTEIAWLLRIFNAAWQQQAAADVKKQAIIITIWKKKAVRETAANIEGYLSSATQETNMPKL